MIVDVMVMANNCLVIIFVSSTERIGRLYECKKCLEIEDRYQLTLAQKYGPSKCQMQICAKYVVISESARILNPSMVSKEYPGRSV